MQKRIKKVGVNTYETDLADLGNQGYKFRFTVDANNNLVNWVAAGNTPAVPQSGFMTADNPGGISYPTTVQPGVSPFIQTYYNNTYDSVTKTFYMHYGYGVGSSGQNGYTRQIYERYVFEADSLTISSITPVAGTAGTVVTIKGKGFNLLQNVSISTSDYNDRLNCDTFRIISDSLWKL